MKNLISWVEIPTINFEKALKFYNEVLKLDLKAQDFGDEKMACFPGGEGAVIFSEGYKPSNNGVLVSLTVSDNVEGTLKRIEENGGKIIQPKKKIEAEGRGYFAVFMDCEGNKLGLYGDE